MNLDVNTSILSIENQIMTALAANMESYIRNLLLSQASKETDSCSQETDSCNQETDSCNQEMDSCNQTDSCNQDESDCDSRDLDESDSNNLVIDENAQ